MPGLFGIITRQHDEQSHDLCEAMGNRMRHHSWYQVEQHEEPSAGIALGRVSLGFIQNRPQPVWNHDRSICLLLDGEIYGEAELRRELLMEGVQLGTAGSHAELLLQGYRQEGRDFFRRVNGTFISAIWECRQRRLTLVSDRFGMKPLYYTGLPQRFLFAAELKSLLADPAVSRASDPQGISQFFSFGQLLGESTLLREIKTLPPAAWLTYCQTDGQLKIDRYWKLTEIKVDDRLSQADFLNRTDEAFAKAVELRTHDSPALGISLSGGLDSRTILACVDPRRTPIKSVSMGMRGSLDHRCAQKMADVSLCEHHCCVLDDRFLRRYEHFMRQMVHLTDGHYLDQCIVLPTLPTYQKLGIQVLLRGHAGELMHMDKAYNFSLDRGGWSIHNAASLRAWLNRQMPAYMLDGLPGPLLADSSRIDLQALAEQSLTEVLSESEGMEPALHRIWHLFITQRLRRETAMSMAKIGTMFETRLPFLDNDVIEILLSAPPHWKRGDQIQSHILNKRRPEFLAVVNANTGAPLGATALRQRATQIRNRVFAKLGLPGYQPYERLGLWLRRELRTWVEDVLFSPRTLDRGVFEPETVKKVVHNHMNRQSNHTALLLTMLIFELGQRIHRRGTLYHRSIPSRSLVRFTRCGTFAVSGQQLIGYEEFPPKIEWHNSESNERLGIQFMSVRSVKPRKKKTPENGTSSNGAINLHTGAVLKRDRDLVRRCLKGDVAAWQEMFDRCQPHLLVSIGALLKPYGSNMNLAEEIASRVWFSLVGANGRLLDRFDAHRGCQLTTFVSALARHELLMYWRTEKRQRKREQAAMVRRPSVHPDNADYFQIVWDEFVATLTQRERSFLEEVLLVPSAHETENLSQTNFWQLRSRVMTKLKQYSSNENA